jgi:hypothetical protein
MKYSFASIVILFLCVGTVKAQILPTFGNSHSGGSGKQFLKITPDLLFSAMGGAL